MNNILKKLLDAGYVLVLANPLSDLIEEKYIAYSDLSKPKLSKAEFSAIITRIKKILDK